MNKPFIAVALISALIAVSTATVAQQMDPNMPGMAMPAATDKAMQAMMKPGGAPDAEAVAQAFQDALKRGDRTAALGLMAPDAQISEDGKSQSRDEYAAHHLGDDIAFLGKAKIKLISRVSMRMGDNAQVTSDSQISAVSKGKPVVMKNHEQMELKRANSKWKIEAIHWTN